MLQNGGQKPWVYFARYKTLQGPKADTFLFTLDSCCNETAPIDWAISHFTCSSWKQCEFSDCQIRKAIVPEVEAQHWLVEDSFLNIRTTHILNTYISCLKTRGIHLDFGRHLANTHCACTNLKTADNSVIL